MSSTEPCGDTLEQSSSKNDISSTRNLGIRSTSKDAEQGQINSLRAEVPLDDDSNQQRSLTPADWDNRNRSLGLQEQDVVETEGLDKCTGSEHQTDSTLLSPKPASLMAEKTASQDANRGRFSEASSYEGFEDDVHLDPTPRTPCKENSPPRSPAIATEIQEDGSTSEIQSIMDQFEGDEENTQSTLKIKESYLGEPMEHPPRQSSLKPLGPSGQRLASDLALGLNGAGQQGPTHEDRFGNTPRRTSSLPQPAWLQDTRTPDSPNSSLSLPKLPPPEPDPEPDLPFDFHRFLEQLRHRTADPVAKFLRSFLIEFGKKQWMVHEQVKIITDFLTFITNKMGQCEIWRGVSDAEFDNAKEGMEKLVMNRLYSQTFSPAIPAPAPVQLPKGKRKAAERALGPGRKGQHQEDIERDDILAQKVRIYGWVQEKHLDIPPIGDTGRRFLVLAQQGETQISSLYLTLVGSNVWTELLKIKTYRAPRDKVICVLNCCKVIFGKIMAGPFGI